MGGDIDLTNISYKEYHENYLSNHRGGGLYDVPVLLTTVTLVGFHSLYMRCWVDYRNNLGSFLLDVVFTVLPSTYLIILPLEYQPLCFWTVVATFVLILTRELYFRRSNLSLSSALSYKITVKRRPFVTHFKSVISLLTVICILAVDFKVFPKHHIKTEMYGYSLMDTGVGYFLVANGLTTNLKESKGLTRKSFGGIVPILILGIARFVTTEGINYQKHVTEYGVHWNFFFTLALVKFFGPYIAVKVLPKWYVILLWFALHEVLLWAGLETWVLGNTPRTNLLSANREGIVSILGYLFLFVMGVNLGSWLLYDNPKPTVKEELKKARCCFAFFVILTVYLHLNVYLQPSRRLGNPTFVIWMASLCFLTVGISLVLELLSVIFCRRKKCGAHHESSLFVLEAISTNNLAFFLVGNLLTGAVNLSMRTLLLPTSLSLLVISLYIVISTGIISVIHSKKVSLKFW